MESLMESIELLGLESPQDLESPLEMRAVSPTLSQIEDNIEIYKSGPNLFDLLWIRRIKKEYGDKVCILPFDIILDTDSQSFYLYHKIDHVVIDRLEVIHYHLQLCEESPIILLGVVINSAHHNMLIYNRHTDTIERFEPLGNTPEDAVINYNLKQFLTTLGFTKYISNDMCPIQKEGDIPVYKDHGFCIMFSYWYAATRIKYNHLDHIDFVNGINLFFKRKDAIEYIHKYIDFLVKDFKYALNYYDIPYSNPFDMDELTHALLAKHPGVPLINLLENSPWRA